METTPELQSASAIKAQLDGTADRPEPETSNPKDQKVYEFDLDYTDVRGVRWTGHFVNHILTIKEKRLVKVIKARLGGGVPVSSLDADVWEMNEMIAHLQVSLDVNAEGFPHWAKDLENLEDEAIVFELFKEVDGHEARFHRREPLDQEGAGAA